MEATPSDADLVHAAVAGDRRAFSELFERWFDRSYDVAWNIVRDRESASEVAQEAFLAAWTGLGTLRDPAAFGGWILRTSRNKALNRLERERRSRPTDVDVAVDLVDRRQSAADIADDIVRDEQHDLLWAAVAALGEADASILDLHLRHDLDAAQIADALGIEPNAAHQRLFRLRKRLEGAIRSYVIWNGGAPRCVLLGALLVGAELESFGPAVVKLVSGHVVDCDECHERQRAVLAPASMFGAVPLVAVGTSTRRAAAASLADAGVGIDPDAIGRRGVDSPGDPVVSPDSSPQATVSRARRKLAVVTAALVLLLGGAVTVASIVGGGGEGIDLADVTAADAPSDETAVTSAPPTTAADPASTSTTDVDPPGSTPPQPPPPSPEPEPTVGVVTTAATPDPPPPPPPPGPDTTGATTTAPAPTIVRFDAVLGGSVPCAGGGGLELRLVWATEHAEEVVLDGPGADPSAGHPGSGSIDTCLPRGESPEWEITATGPGGSATAHIAR